MKITHLKSLLGRVFLIASPSATLMWNGFSENQNEESDYEKLDGFISCEEGTLTSYSKSQDLNYLIHFSMPSKIELFSTENGFIILSGLYFNQSWDYSASVIIKVKDKLPLNLTVSERKVYIFDAALEGESILKDYGAEEKINIACLPIVDGMYSVFKIDANIVYQRENLLIQGIQVML